MVGARPIENAHGIAADAQPVEWGGDDAERTNRPDIVEEIGAEHRTATDAPPSARRLGGVESDKITGLVTLDHRQQQGSSTVWAGPPATRVVGFNLIDPTWHLVLTEVGNRLAGNQQP